VVVEKENLSLLDVEKFLKSNLKCAKILKNNLIVKI